MIASTDILERLQTTHQENEELRGKVFHLSHENTYLKEQIEWFKRQLFGEKSERVVSDLNSQQLEFEGFENPKVSFEVEKKTVKEHKRRTG